MTIKKAKRVSAGVNRSAASGLLVAIIDAHALVRYGLQAMLNEVSSVGRVVVAASPEAIEELFAAFDPDIILLPSDIPFSDFSLILDAAPSRSVLIVLIRSTDLEQFQAASRVPAAGFLLQEELTSQSLAQAFALIESGSTPLPKAFADYLLTVSSQARETLTRPRLSPMESKVLMLVGEGLSNKEIARDLAIGEITVKHCVAAILAKLGAPNRAAAVVSALKIGYLTLESEAPQRTN